MRIVYLSDAQIPSRATNAMQSIRMCSAFAAAGAEVTLVHPNRFGNRPEGLNGDIWDFYGIRERFKIVTLPTPLTLTIAQKQRLARALRGGPLAAYMLGLSLPSRPASVIYSRSLLGAWLALRARSLWRERSALRGVVFEAHDEPATRSAWRVVTASDLVVAISQALQDRLVEVEPLLTERTIVEHDAVDLEAFGPDRMDRDASRRELGIDEHEVVIGYTGRVNADKGTEAIVRCARAMNNSRLRFLLVGKVYDEGIRYAAKRAGNVILTGFVPPGKVPTYVAAADILVLPTSASIAYARYTSPLKLFEYMASGRPIICSNLPVITEVLEDRRNALFFEADDPVSLSAAVSELVGKPDLRTQLAAVAREDVQAYSWKSRAARILGRIRELET
jgi:glycosyltransferase involved in cell wall biosynthesis